jgi:hypothetical protein
MIARIATQPRRVDHLADMTVAETLCGIEIQWYWQWQSDEQERLCRRCARNQDAVRAADADRDDDILEG